MLIEVNELRLLIELLDVKVGARWLLRAERKGGRGGGPPEQGGGQGGGQSSFSFPPSRFTSADEDAFTPMSPF